MNIFYIKIESDNIVNGGGISASPSISTNLSSMDGGEEESKEPVITFKKSLIDLTLNANGKADLYFHAYLWLTLI